MRIGVVFLFVSLVSSAAIAQTETLPAGLTAYPHARLHSSTGPTSTEYLLGLGALQKIGGKWRHKHSERVTGELLSYTWQINEAYTSAEAFQWVVDRIPESALLLYECAGRDCGSSAQWASRVFEERLLYGHEDRQRYGVWRIGSDSREVTVILYASDRANRNHYLRMDILQVDRPGETP